MTIQKMDFQEPKLTTKGHQRHEQNAKYVCMFVYMLDKCTRSEKMLLSMDCFILLVAKHVNAYFKSCLRFEKCEMCIGLDHSHLHGRPFVTVYSLCYQTLLCILLIFIPQYTSIPHMFYLLHTFRRRTLHKAEPQLS